MTHWSHDPLITWPTDEIPESIAHHSLYKAAKFLLMITHHVRELLQASNLIKAHDEGLKRSEERNPRQLSDTWNRGNMLHNDKLSPTQIAIICNTVLL